MSKHKKFSEEEQQKIQKQLNKKLAPEYISYRLGFNRVTVPYIEGWTIISLANQIFGFNGWSSQIIKMEIDYESKNMEKYDVGVSCIVRITLKDGTYKEDVGYGSSENQRRKMEAFSKARKEAATDALKRALRQFGNALGNCCYDKAFINHVKKMEKKADGFINAKDLYGNEEEDSLDLDDFSSIDKKFAE